MFKISVVVPICNSAQYLSSCIESVLQQTLQEIELICVDDASVDDSANIIKEYVDKDHRVRGVRFNSNRSALQARKAGTMLANGKYLLFVDADDYLDPNACEYLYMMMEKESVDILHFNSAIENCGTIQARVDNMVKFVKPYMGFLQGNEVFEACFDKNEYRFNLWNKCYSVELVKRAFMDIPDGYYPKANDLATYFAIAFHAKSYKGIDSPKLYHYCFGRGSTGSNNLTIEKFKTYCHEAHIAKLLENFLITYNCLEKYAGIVHQLSHALLNECLNNWMEYLPISLSPQGFDLLVEYWGKEITVDALIQRYHFKKLELVDKLKGAKTLQYSVKKADTLGIFYHRMAKGGVQRVISLLIPMYLEMGYQIVLFTDEIDLENEYPVSPAVKRVILPSSTESAGTKYKKRGDIFREKLVKYQVDIMFYHAASSEILIFDALIVKTLGIPFVVTVHELFSQHMVSKSMLICKKAKFYHLVDCLIVLSQIEQMYWNALGISAVYVPNPVEYFEVKECGEHNYILWLGRLEQIQKQYMDAVAIMEKVVNVLPNSKMRIVGNEVTNGAFKQLNDAIHKKHLENNIEICGFSDEVAEYYKNASVFLMTSSFESFSMTIMESKMWHLPLVTYKMPYLELLKDQKGYIEVEQGDTKGAAEAIVSLLTDDHLMRTLSDEAWESIQQFAHIDLKKIWQDIIDGIISHKKYETKYETMHRKDVGVILDTILFHYSKGVSYQVQRPQTVCRPEYRFSRWLTKINNLYIYYKDHGKRATCIVIVHKIKQVFPQKRNSLVPDKVGKLPAPNNINIIPKRKGNVEIRWESVPNADGYILYRSLPQKKDYKWVATLKKNRGNILRYINKGVNDNIYYYKIVAYKETQTGHKILGEYSLEQCNTIKVRESKLRKLWKRIRR